MNDLSSVLAVLGLTGEGKLETIESIDIDSALVEFLRKETYLVLGLSIRNFVDAIEHKIVNDSLLSVRQERRTYRNHSLVARMRPGR